MASLSRAGGSFLLYCAVGLVSASSAVFGLDWIAAPLPPMPETEASVQAAKLAARFPPPVQHVAKAELTAPAVTAAQPPQRRPAQVATVNPAARNVRNVTTAPAVAAPEQTAAQPNASAQPKCDIAACSVAYRSFRASDCSWQPYEGPRRLCDKGTPPQQDVATGGAGADTTALIDSDQSNVSNKCDIAACKQAYFTFDPADCTYQPSHGPRRICDKGTPPRQDVTANAAPATDDAGAKSADGTDHPKCDVEACRQAYFTFNPADCTFQPSNGPRRICDKGTPPKQDATAQVAPAAADTDAKPAADAEPPKCNVEACRQAYFTFKAEDCTYQPSNGPRRLCTK
jgi:hypothetical protein